MLEQLILRRRVGATIPRLVAILRELKQQDAIDRDDSNAEIAAAILSQLALEQDDPQAISDIDWERLLEMIIRLLPLLLVFL